MIQLDLNQEEARLLFKHLRRPTAITDLATPLRRVRERIALAIEEDPNEVKHVRGSLVPPLPGQTSLETLCDFDSGDFTGGWPIE